MANSDQHTRITELVQKAHNARREDSNQEAADAVREVLSIDPNNKDVKDLFEGLSLNGGNAKDVFRMCSDYYNGTTSREYFRSTLEESAIDIEGTRETFEFAFEHKGERNDEIFEALLTKANGRRALMPLLLAAPTETFRAIWSLGLRSINALVQQILLQQAVWNQEDDRRRAEKDVMVLLLAKLLEAGQDHPENAMLAIARLLAVDASFLKDVLDSDCYRILFSKLDQGNKQATRSQATVALAKLRDAAPERWDTELMGYVESMAQTQKIDNLIAACCAVSTLFPVAASTCAKMFLREGFVTQLMHLVGHSSTNKPKEAALELFSAACIDPQCRQTIQKYCAEWLADVAATGDVDERKGNIAVTATLVNSKIRDNDEAAGGKDDALVAKLRTIVSDKSSPQEAIEKAIEGLQYQTVHPQVKDDVAKDETFLKQLIAFLSKPSNVGNGPLVYVGLNIFQNLTRYPPVLSQEQRKIAELKAYANKTSLPKTHPLDEEVPVSDRCAKVLDAGITSLLVGAAKRATLALHQIISSIILALSKHPRHRGKMAQQGLFDIAFAEASIDNETGRATLTRRQSALAVARIMIPIDPSLLFKGRDILRTIKVLKGLLEPQIADNETDANFHWWQGFPIVTAVQALTNLATYQASADKPDLAADLIIQECWDVLEDLWTTDVMPIRVAVTECFANLTLADAGVEKFVTEGSRSKARMHILIGFWGDDGEVSDKLNEAAGGALAQLLPATEQAVELFIEHANAAEWTNENLSSKNPALVHRAVAIAAAILQPVEDTHGKSDLARRVMKEIDSSGEHFKRINTLARTNGPWNEQAKCCSKILKEFSNIS